MYGIDPITRQCVYKTPCGWCARLEKECNIERRKKSSEESITKGMYRLCLYLKNGRCMGTKEMEPCKEDKCTNMRFK